MLHITLLLVSQLSPPTHMRPSFSLMKVVLMLTGKDSLYSLGSGCRLLETLLLPPLIPSKQPFRFDDDCCEIIGRCVQLVRVLMSCPPLLLIKLTMRFIEEQLSVTYQYLNEN